MQQCQACRKMLSHSMQCSRCKSAFYCDALCQKTDWKAHRVECSSLIIAGALQSQAIDFPSFVKKFDGSRKLRIVATTEDLENNLVLAKEMQQMLRPSKFDRDEVMHYMKQMAGKGAIKIPLRYENAVARRPSLIHGEGVFACMELPADVIVSFYACDGICDEVTDMVFPIIHNDGYDIDGSRKSRELTKRFKLNLGAKWQLAITATPKRPRPSHFLGHMINDGAANPLSGWLARDFRDATTLKAALESYWWDTERRTNARFYFNRDQTLASVVTTRAIKTGEELFVRYGIYYWFDELYGLDWREKYPFIVENIISFSLEDKCRLLLS